MVEVVYETSRWRRRLAEMAAVAKYEIIRPLVSDAAWVVRRKATLPKRRPGITYCLAVRNERETVISSLRSLIGIADDVVAIDNGSTDDTLELVREFAMKETGLRSVVLSRPGATLRDVRQEAADLVETTWFVRGDADMIFLELLRRLKPELLGRRRPAGILCRKLNTFGDHRHYNGLFGPVSDGEYFLRSHDDDVRYIEYGGRLEHALIPLHYELIRPRDLSMLHLDGMKPNERIFFRTCYLDWRQLVNHWPAGSGPAPNFEGYKAAWIRHNLGTDDAVKARFRMARLVAAQCVRLPEALADIVSGTEGACSERFRVEYLRGAPWIRIDAEDRDLAEYKPDAEDAAWVPDPDRYYRDSIRTRVLPERT